MANVSNCSLQLGTGYVGVYNGVEDCSIGTTGVKSTIRLIGSMRSRAKTLK